MNVLEPGTDIDRYRIVRRIGEGGMGVVYEAHDPDFDRRVAIKLMQCDLGSHASGEERLVREARAAARVQHPGLVQVYDLGTYEGAPYFVMECLEGEDLQAYLARIGKLSHEETLRIGIEAAEAVGAAHARQIVHRDLKPSNLYLARYDRRRVLKVLDFGVAKLIDPGSETITDTGQGLGTLRYMAPEQMRDAKRVDARADVYSLGAVLYECLAGQPAFRGESGPELILRIVSESPPALSAIRPDLPRALVSVIERAMARDPNGRPANARELAHELESVLSSPAPTEPSLGPLATDDTQPGMPLPTCTAQTPSTGAALARRSRLFWPALTLALLAAGTIFAVVSTRSVPTPSAIVPTPKMSPATAAPAAPAAAASLPNDTALPASISASLNAARLKVNTLPAGAQVEVDGELACVAPCWVRIGSSDSHQLVARMPGYTPHVQKVQSPFPESIELVLKRRKVARPPPPMPTR